MRTARCHHINIALSWEIGQDAKLQLNRMPASAYVHRSPHHLLPTIKILWSNAELSL